MSDPMTPEVRDWMKRTDVEPPDAHESAQRVRARLPGVRQRRRWWPFPVFYRKPETPPTDHPTMIPATNGHTPTITGRTSSMLNPAKAITAGALVFAIGGAFVIAQPFGQQGSIPGAEGDEAVMEVQEDASYFTGEMIWEGAPPVISGEITIVDGVLHHRGTVAEGDAIEVSDPRVSGPLTIAQNANVYHLNESEMTMFRTVEWRIENDAGSWTGQGTNPSPRLDGWHRAGRRLYTGWRRSAARVVASSASGWSSSMDLSTTDPLGARAAAFTSSDRTRSWPSPSRSRAASAPTTRWPTSGGAGSTTRRCGCLRAGT